MAEGRTELVAEARDAAEHRVTPDSYYDAQSDREATARAEGFNAAQEILQPIVEELIGALAAPQEPSECSNSQCPLRRAHSGPCAPEGWTPDREKLIDEATLTNMILGKTATQAAKDIKRYLEA